MEKTNVKILFNFYSDLLEKQMVETVWAEVIDEEKGYYKINNIPFYVPDVASDDIVKAEFDKDEDFLVFKEAIEYSGNSIIRVIKFDKTLEINALRDKFNDLDCPSEKMGKEYFVMEVPEKVDYKIIKNELQKMEESGIISYEEAVLSDEHRQNL